MSPSRFIIETTDGPGFELVGIKLGHVSSRGHKDDRSQWSVLEVYQAVSGRYVAVRERHFATGKTKREGRVFERPEEIQQWLGWSWLTRDLYDLCGFDSCRERIE